MTTMTMPMMETYPKNINFDRRVLATTVDVLLDCSEACTACADSCLSEEDMLLGLAKTIRTNLDCADICSTTARVLSRHTGYDANITLSLLQACVTACRSCADECEMHTDMEHCRLCAQACRRCEQACNDLIIAMHPARM